MRLAYLSVPVLGLLLVGCGPDEEREREASPAPATTEQPTAPASGSPNSDAGSDAGTSGMGNLPGAEPNDPAGDVETAPGDNGSGLGTSSGAGTAPNTTGTGTGANQ